MLRTGSYEKVCGRDRQSSQISTLTAKKQAVMLPQNGIDSLQIQGHQAQMRQGVPGQTQGIGYRSASRTGRPPAPWPGEIKSLWFPN